MLHTPKILSLPMDPRLLVKEECLKKAAEIRQEGKLDRLSEQEIARELYFHAVVYFLCRRLRPFFLCGSSWSGPIRLISPITETPHFGHSVIRFSGGFRAVKKPVLLSEPVIHPFHGFQCFFRADFRLQ